MAASPNSQTYTLIKYQYQLVLGGMDRNNTFFHRLPICLLRRNDMEITLPASNSLSPPDTCDRGPNKKREIKGQKIAWATKRSARGKPNAAAERRRRASLVPLRMLAMGSSHSCQKHRHLTFMAAARRKHWA